MNSMQGNGGEKTTPQPQLGERLLHLLKEGEAKARLRAAGGLQPQTPLGEGGRPWAVQQRGDPSCTGVSGRQK